MPSIKTLMSQLNLTKTQAIELREAMAKNKGIAAYNRMINLYGVEAIFLPEDCMNNCQLPQHTIRYANTGDTYKTTLLKVDGKYIVGNWGDYVEQWS